ncbi:hypothetical protein JOF29_000502 [Kribbella aluminosa]|uniref:Uncharacterized protein n=1 Tax=Kribbella aluminosa TaxID=416017 RepID=A0ABS4UCV5_9ACTN|nr:hypothetical protein [Kribbella aluminosa]MBP2349419.1 hypothetical protein [Kribbella aluminosa]
MDSEQVQQLVQQARGAEHLPPEDRDRDARAEQRRQVEDGSIKRHSPNTPVQDHGEQQRDRQLQRHRDEHVGERHLQRVVQPLVGQHPGEVLQADPLRRLDQVVVREGQVQRGQHRPDRDQEQAQQPRREEEVPGQVVLLAGMSDPTAPVWLLTCRFLPPEAAELTQRTHRLVTSRTAEQGPESVCFGR